MRPQHVPRIAYREDRDELPDARVPQESGDLTLKHTIHALDRYVELMGDLRYRAAAIGKGLRPDIHDSGSMGMAIHAG